MKHTIFNLLLCLAWPLPLLAVDHAPAADGVAQIVRVDLSYGLFAALAQYHELNEAEKRGEAGVNARFIPVLREIIGEFEHEREKYWILLQNTDSGKDRRLLKIDAHLDDFKQELRFRQTVEEYNALLREQKAITLEK